MGRALNKKIYLEHRFIAACFFKKIKKHQIFSKKIPVCSNEHYKSVNFECKISCILGAAKKTNMINFGNMVAHSECTVHSWICNFLFFAEARIHGFFT
jgi:hypothetical protein